MAKRPWVALVVGALLAGPVAGQVVRATVEVQGMSCPFCAFGVEKRLRKVDGVSAIAVAMNESLATLEAGEGKSIDLSGIPEAVRKAGFTPGRVEAEVVGSIHRGESQSNSEWLLAAGGEGVLLVNIVAELAEELAELAGSGAVARVRGAVRLPIGEHVLLEPLEVQAIR